MFEKYPESYIGVSGVVNESQQEQLESFAEEFGFTRLRRQLMLGVKATHKTQFLDIPNKYGPEWYPVGGEQFEKAISERKFGSKTIAVAQAYFDVDYVDNQKYRDEFSNRIFERGEQWIDGIQLDMLPWQANPVMLDFLAELKSKHHTKILLQCHKKAMELLGPKGVSEKLGYYSDSIDYVLFDSSHGTGAKLDVDKLKYFIDAGYDNCELNSVGFAIAGGLNEETVREELPKILGDFPDVSWDAEGNLHPMTKDATRPIDMDVAKNYLRSSAKVVEDLKY